MASDSDETIRFHSIFREIPAHIWSNRKSVFSCINRVGDDKIRQGFLITHDDAVYAAGDNFNGLLGLEQSRFNNANYQLNSRLSHLMIEDVQVGTEMAAARTAAGNLLVWGPGLRGIVEPTLASGPGGNGPDNIESAPAIIIHHFCGTDYVMAVTKEGELLYFKPRPGSVSSQNLLRPLWPYLKLPAFQWCGGTKGAAFGLTTCGKLYSWGRNKHAELGRLTVTRPEEATGAFRNYKLESLPQLVEIPSGLAVDKVACGLYHAAALTCCGKLYIWGSNTSGILGSSSPKQAFLPQVVTHFKLPVTALAMSKIRLIAVCRLSNGKVYAWGALSRRLGASSSEPVRTPFSHIPAALIHFDMEFQMFWGLKPRGDEPSNRQDQSGNDRHLQAMLSVPSLPMYMPSTPVYCGSTPVYAPATPLYVPSTPVYVPSTPVYAPSTPHYVPSTPTYAPPTPTYAPSTPTYAPPTPTHAPSTPTYAPPTPTYPPTTPTYAPPAPTYAPRTPTHAPRTPTYAPSTPAYSDQQHTVIEYNHGFDGATPIEESPRISSYDYESFKNSSPPQIATLKALRQACPVASTPPLSTLTEPLPSPPTPSERSNTRNRKLLNEYHHMMKLLNPPSTQTATSPMDQSCIVSTSRNTPTNSSKETRTDRPAALVRPSATVSVTRRNKDQPKANPRVVTAPTTATAVSASAKVRDMPSKATRPEANPWIAPIPSNAKRSEANPFVLAEPPPAKKSRFSDAQTHGPALRDNKAHNRTLSPERRFMRQLSVPAAAASALIGAKGYNIKCLNRATKAHIQISGSRKARYQLVIIEGPTDDIVELAFNKVREFIRPYLGKL